MSCRNISWIICTFVAVAIAAGYSGQDTNAEPSTAEPVQEVKPNATVELAALLDAGEGAVVTLVTGGARLLAHRAVLAARSPVFQRALLDSSTGEVAVQGVEDPVLRHVVAYLYTLQAPRQPGMAPQLLAAADQFSLPALKADCEQQVAAQLSVETAAATAVLAIRHSSDSLRDAAIAYIKAHIFHVVATRGWADALIRQPEVMANVTQLLSESPAETSSAASAGNGTSPHPATQLHSDNSGRQTLTTAAPTVAAQTITQTDGDYVSLLRSLSPEEKGRRLREAAKEGAVGELEALLVAGADAGAVDEVGWTALHRAAAEGHVEAARRLLAAGAAVDARSDWGQWTPLHRAAVGDRVDVARLLLAAHADHGARDVLGRTPLHWAALYGHTEAAAALLEGGADRGATDDEGQTPLDVARELNHQQVVELLQADSGVTAATSPK